MVSGMLRSMPMDGPGAGIGLHAPPPAAQAIRCRGGTVEKAWLLSRRLCSQDGRFDVFPDAHFGVGFELAGGRCTLVCGGPITRRIRPYVGDSEIHWLRFRPGKLPRIADVAPRDLVNKPGIALDRIPGVDLDELGERLAAAEGIAGRLKILEAVLREEGPAALCQDRRCRQVLEMIDALDGCLRVEDLSREFGLSVRTLQRLLQEQVGLSPKQLLLNVRLQRAIERLRGRGRRDRLSECASACGFADQSHMIRVFRTQTGRLPSAF